MRIAAPPVSCKVYTPPSLAAAIVRFLGDQSHLMWLEPSHGTGAFVQAASQLGVGKERIVAIDLDRTGSAADRLATTIRGVDFLRWATRTRQRFDRIVGNPPFVSIKRLPRSLQKTAESVQDLDGKTVGRGSNIWYSFVLTSLRLLNDGGSLAFVLPSAAAFADYSSAMRRAVRENFSTLEIYRCERPLFDNVQEGTLVVVARGYRHPPCRVSRKDFNNREALIKGLLNGLGRNGHRCPLGSTARAESTVAMNDIAQIRLGGVTGDATYFLLTDKKRQELDLPLEALAPVVSKARHLRSAFLNKMEWDSLRESGERIWLFNPSSKIAKVSTVRKYLKLQFTEGGCNRKAYKVSIREPWYRTSMPILPDAFLSGMSQHGPWLCINEMDGLNATNTLYVVTFRDRNRNTWYKWALALLTSTAQRQIYRLGRRYADGLIKYEPGALSRVKLPEVRADVDLRSCYEKAVKALLKGDRVLAKRIADSALSVQPNKLHVPGRTSARY